MLTAGERHPPGTGQCLPHLRQHKAVRTCNNTSLEHTLTTTITYRSEANERTPLNAGPSFHNRRKSQTAVKAYAILLLLAIVTIFVVFIGLALPDMERQVRRQRRASWTNELREHANLHAEWDRQRVEYEKEGHAMAAERGLWHAERVQWEGERAEHEREHEEWRQEREQREREREEWQKERDDDDRRAAMRLYWDSPLNLGRCQAWGVRHYWGRLWNVETGYNATRACQRTPVVVNDVVLMQPDRCEDRVCTLFVFIFLHRLTNSTLV